MFWNSHVSGAKGQKQSRVAVFYESEEHSPALVDGVCDFPFTLTFVTGSGKLNIHMSYGELNALACQANAILREVDKERLNGDGY